MTQQIANSIHRAFVTGQPLRVPALNAPDFAQVMAALHAKRL